MSSLDTGDTVTDTLFVADPALFAQTSVYEAEAVGDTVSLPESAFVPLQLPLAVQLVASVDFQVRVEESPAVIAVGSAERVRVGSLTFGCTVIETSFVTKTPAVSVQVRV